MATGVRTTIQAYLGARAESLLGFHSPKIAKERLHLPGPDFIDRVWASSDRNIRVLTNLQRLLEHGRLGRTGYLSILPVDQGIEHAAGASFAKNPDYFDGENIVKLAIEGGCNAVASTYGVLGSVARKYAHKIPFILKLNHNETLSYPISYDQVIFAQVKQAFDMGAVGIGVQKEISQALPGQVLFKRQHGSGDDSLRRHAARHGFLAQIGARVGIEIQ